MGLHVSRHLILHDRRYYSHLTDKETETRQVQQLPRGPVSSEWWREDANSALSRAKPLVIMLN